LRAGEVAERGERAIKNERKRDLTILTSVAGQDVRIFIHYSQVRRLGAAASSKNDLKNWFCRVFEFACTAKLFKTGSKSGSLRAKE
jgi:hypothetical protein